MDTLAEDRDDVMTLENFCERLPKWDREAKCHLYGIVDIGSNGIRFSISDLEPRQARLLKTKYRERADISLYDAINESPDLSIGAPVVERTIQVITRFRRISRDFSVPEDHFLVVATAALRTARNRQDIMDKVLEKAGTRIQLLDPQVEALFGSMGARSGISQVPGGLFLDLGGGSVQMTWIDTTKPDYHMEAARAGQSRKFGAAKLNFVLATATASAQEDEKTRLRIEILDAFHNVQAHFGDLKAKVVAGEELDIYMAGGGFRGYGSMVMHSEPIQPYPFPNEGTYTVRGPQFKETGTMRRLNETTKEKIFGMSKRRRSQFPAIAEVVEALIGAVPNIRSATFCPGSNREGVLMMMLPKDIRDLDPLAGLDEFPDAYRVLAGAMPSDAPGPTVLSLGMANLFLSQARNWASSDAATNASKGVHEAVTGLCGAVGLSEPQRAVLAVASCYRWCSPSKLSRLDASLYDGIRNWLNSWFPNAYFWAAYVGSITRIMASFSPLLDATTPKRIRFGTMPGSPPNVLGLIIKIDPSFEGGEEIQDISILKDIKNKHPDAEGPKKCVYSITWEATN